MPTRLHAAIAEQEAVHPEADSWTLTWLEGRPRCELAGAGLAPVALVAENAAGSVVVETSAASGAAASGDTETDDDWLT
ncbi:Fe-S oxidoreductase [Leucobacter triazinivorans]|uniref:Fe-S oxidoreductase n=1 Tax=Leucobacter triazinivorans TaxID=1784719 RepID=UPI001F0E05D7|nr:Fe-S oxidoreductase [Leucobacter triazinivorans]